MDSCSTTANEGNGVLNHDMAMEEDSLSAQNESETSEEKTAQGKVENERLSEKPVDNNLDGQSLLHSFGCSSDDTVTDISDEPYCSKVVQDLHDALINGSFCDITLLIGQEEHPIKAHRVILASASDFFKAIFTTDLKEGTQPEIKLPKTDIATMKALIEFAYVGKLQVTESNVESLVTAANFYGMSRIVDRCIKYIMGKINNSNSIEILEFAERISNKELKDFALRFVVKNFEAISSKNLDVMEMTTKVLFKIIGHNETAIHPDPTENEERLFQLGWNHLKFKSEEAWEQLLPQLLEAVHLPQVSNQFLQNLAEKVGNSENVTTLIEKAKQLKSTLTHYMTSAKKDEGPKNIKWAMRRYIQSGFVSVRCDGIKNDSTLHWCGVPAFIRGIPWSLTARIHTDSENGRPVYYLATYLQCMQDLESESISCKAEVSLLFPKNQKYEHIIGKFDHTFTASAPNIGYPKALTLAEVMAECYDEQTKSCTIVAHVTVDPDSI